MNDLIALDGVTESLATGEYRAAEDDIHVLAFAHPLRTDEFIESFFPAGLTVWEIIGQQEIPAVIVVDGDLITREEWQTTVPRNHVIIRKTPEDSDIGRIIAAIGVVIFAAFAGPYAAGLFNVTSAGGIAAFTAGIGIVGNLVLNALIPPPGLGDQEDVQRLGNITGQSNRVAPYSPIPRVLGTRKFYPPVPMTALPFTELVGQDQYIRILLCLGYGPLDVGGQKVGTGLSVVTDYSVFTSDPITIDDTPLDQFTDVQFELGASEDITLFTDSIVESQVNVTMPPQADPTSNEQTVIDNLQAVRTTEVDTDEVSLDLFFPALFTVSENGNTRYARVKFRVEYSVTGADSWTTAKEFTVASIEKKSVRYGTSFNLPSTGQYDIRLTRVETFYGRKTTFVSDCTWTVLRSIKRDITPFLVPNTVCLAIRIKQTDQLGSTIGRIATTASAYVQVWNGSAWNEEISRSPAWAYNEVLTGVAAKSPLDYNTQVDADDLKAWADWAAGENLYYDEVLDNVGTVFDRAREIAAVAFGSWHITDAGKLSVVRDVASTSKMPITARNSFNFSTDHLFNTLPHALRVQFLDPVTLERIEREVYDDGYTAANATRYEELQTSGITTSDHAWKMGRYHLAVLRTRPETYTYEQDIQKLVYRRGDSVEINQDSILVGLGSGRITAVNSNTQIVVDSEFFMEVGPSYGIKVQLQDGTIQTDQITPVSPSATTLDLNTGISGMNVGDLVVYGEFGTETLKARVTRIEHRTQLRALITAVPAVDNIFDAWTGQIPAFDPVITDPIDFNLLPPIQPRVLSVTTDFNTSLPDGSGILRSRLVVSFEMPPGLVGVRVQLRIRTKETLAIGTVFGLWRIVAEASSDAGVIIATDLEPSIGYQVSIRSIKDDGRASDWTTPQDHFFDPPDQRPITPLPLDVRYGEGAISNKFTPNENSVGTATLGYIRVGRGFYLLPDGTIRQNSFDPVGLGAYGQDDDIITPFIGTRTPPDGVAWIISGVDTVTSRFGGTNTEWGLAAAAGFFVARYSWSQDKWYAIRGDDIDIEFTPLPTDVIVAQIQKTSLTGGIDKVIVVAGAAPTIHATASYSQSRNWTRAPNAGAWTPSGTTNVCTVRFYIGGALIAERLEQADLNTTDGVITLSTTPLSSSRDSTSVVYVDNNTTSPSAIVTHIRSGIAIQLDFTSIQGGDSGAGADGADGADGAPGIAPFSGFRGGVGALTTSDIIRNENSGGTPDEGEIHITAGYFFFNDGSQYQVVSDIQVNTPYESTVRTAEAFYVVLGKTGTAFSRFGNQFDTHNFFVAEYDGATDTWQAVDNAANTVAYTPLTTDVIVAIGSRPSTGDAGIRHLASWAWSYSLDSNTAPLFIQSAAITSALIGSLAADKIVAGNITAALNITTGNLQISNTGKLFSGKSTYAAAAAGYIFEANSGQPRFKIGNALGTKQFEYDGTDVIITGGRFKGVAVHELFSRTAIQNMPSSTGWTDIANWQSTTGDAGITLVSGIEFEFDTAGTYLVQPNFDAIKDSSGTVASQLFIKCQHKPAAGAYSDVSGSEKRQSVADINSYDFDGCSITAQFVVVVGVGDRIKFQGRSRENASQNTLDLQAASSNVLITRLDEAV